MGFSSLIDKKPGVNKMSIKSSFMAASVLAASLFFLPSANAQLSRDYHVLMVGVPNSSNINSVYVVGRGAYNTGFETCIRVTRGGDRGAITWVTPPQQSLVANGTPVTIRGFTSTRCLNGIVLRRMSTVPGFDRLTNFWFSLR
ncbi:hypothetical protein [Xanthomonas arboricola]|uniref:hypothetical protein n=1 Tax=Xanthomonas arboricola TaxID=56448 RepID=UPI00128FFF1B|nr:hypothetical protein [Xanthomonas arboricola]